MVDAMCTSAYVDRPLAIDAADDKRVVLAMKLRDEIVEAALWRSSARLFTLATTLHRAKLSANAVILSGFPLLIQDEIVWPAKVRTDINKLASKWREDYKELHTEHPSRVASAQCARRRLEMSPPFRGKLCSDMVCIVDALEEALRLVDGSPGASRSFRALAAVLATRG